VEPLHDNNEYTGFFIVEAAKKSAAVPVVNTVLAASSESASVTGPVTLRISKTINFGGRGVHFDDSSNSFPLRKDATLDFRR
jgi:hypothetical protein